MSSSVVLARGGAPRGARAGAVADLTAVAIVIAALLGSTPVARAESPYATAVVSYAPGMSPAFGYTNPQAALGPPERFTGEGLSPQAVTPFQPAFLSTEIVSLGAGGSLVLAFDHEVVDDPNNPFGIDLLVFGNAFFGDSAAPAGIVNGTFSEGGSVWLSDDGRSWTPVPALAADGPFPTLGYLDVTPYATAPGRIPSDFTRPVDPALGGPALVGVSWNELLAMYGGSGGGAGIDLASLGLTHVRYVRIDGNPGFGQTPEIDALADVAPVVAADLDHDGDVDAGDLAIFLGAWGPGASAADLDGDDDVDAGDLAILLGAWS